MTATPRFFITGGTLPDDADSYVWRSADANLHQGLISGEFCYVLDTRQMGKSSLMVREAAALRSAGATVLMLDLTAIGQNVTVEQWYDGLLNQTGRGLRLEDEFDAFRRANRHLGPMQRWFSALRDVALERFPARFVVFVDEIDVVRSLPFSTDEFFAGIRECYNLRATSPQLNRLTFCLLGVATPASLIRDTRMTPFNIGRRIDLHDFTRAEAAPLVAGLNGGRRGTELLDRVLFWTGGHPYLTQRLCQAVAEDPQAQTVRAVDQHCRTLFLARHAQERDDNLLFVRDRILRSDGEPAVLLDLYQKVHAGKQVRPDDLRPGVTALLLSGIVRADGPRLRVRNRIYERVFDRSWIHSRMPDAELRRQRSAFRRGVLRTAAVTGTVVLVMAALAVAAIRNAQIAGKNGRAANERLRESRRLSVDLSRALTAQKAATNAERKALAKLRSTLAAERREHDRAETQSRFATAAGARASKALADSRSRTVRLLEASGARALEQDDYFGALMWYVEAAKADAGNPGRAALHRIRLGSLIRCAPRLQQMWFGVKAARFLRGNRVLLACSDGTARVMDVDLGKEIGSRLAHGPGLLAVEVSPDGRRAITADPQTARLWDLTSRKLIREIRSVNALPAGAGAVFAAFSPDSRMAVVQHRVAGNWAHWDDGWDVAIIDSIFGATIRHLTINYDLGRTVRASFAPDGRHVAGVFNGEAVLWDLDVDRHADRFVAGDDAVHRVLVSKDGATILAGCDKGRVQSFSWRNKDPNGWAAFHQRIINDICMSPDGSKVYSASSDRTVQAFRIDNGKRLASIAHPGPVQLVTASPDGRRIATACGDMNVRILDAETGSTISSLLPHSAQVTSIEFDADGRRLLTSDSSGIIRIWDTAGAAEPDAFVGEIGNVNRFAIGRSGLLAMSDFDWTARIWNPRSNRPVGASLIHAAKVDSLAVNAEGTQLATACPHHGVIVWTVHGGKPVHLLPSHGGNGEGRQVKFCGDGTCLATTSFHELTVWDLKAGRKKLVTETPDHLIDVSLTRDGQLIAFGTRRPTSVLDRGFVEIWNTRTGRKEMSIRHDASITRTEFSPDGKMLLYTCADGAARLVPVSPGRRTPHVLFDGKPVIYAGFNPDGRQVVTTSGGEVENLAGDARIWDTSTGMPVGPPMQHRGSVLRAAWSFDGKMVVTCSQDGTAQVWDAETCQPITPPLRHTDAVDEVLFTPNGGQLITREHRGVARSWRLVAASQPLSTIEQFAAASAARRVDRGGGLSRLEPASVKAAWSKAAPNPGTYRQATARQRVAWHMQEAMLDLLSGRNRDALPHLDEVLTADPDNLEMRALRVQACSALGLWDRIAADQTRIGGGAAQILVMASHGPARSIRGNRAGISIAGQLFSDGLNCWAACRLLVLLPARATRFTAHIGISPEKKDVGGEFYVRVAGKDVWKVVNVREGQPPIAVSAPLSGCTAFELESKSFRFDAPVHWAEARIELVNGRTLRLCDLPILSVSDL